jgi:biofilm PGA synthesis N-glycosyltransferase PgaC
MYQTKEVSEQRQARFDASVIALPTRTVDRYQPRKRAYVSVRTKFMIAIASATAWLLLCVFLAKPWGNALADLVGETLAWIAIAGIALIPGFMNAFMLVSLAMDNRPTRSALLRYPGISILVAAYNEEDNIVSTISPHV